MKEIVYVTGNAGKFEVARDQVTGSDIVLIHNPLETPEIQSADVNEIAAYSAKWASENLQKPVAVTDAGFYIKALNGFPGPFVKFINNWLSAEDILKLMEKKEDRTVEVKACLAYGEPGEEPVLFNGFFYGQIAKVVGKKGATSINEIFIPQGFDKPASEISQDEILKYWGSDGTWQKLREYLISEAQTIK